MVGMLNAALYYMLLLHCVLIDHYKLSGHKKNPQNKGLAMCVALLKKY